MKSKVCMYLFGYGSKSKLGLANFLFTLVSSHCSLPSPFSSPSSLALICCHLLPSFTAASCPHLLPSLALIYHHLLPSFATIVCHYPLPSLCLCLTPSPPPHALALTLPCSASLSFCPKYLHRCLVVTNIPCSTSNIE